MKKLQNKSSPFDFLREGKNKQFDSAMKSMDNLYDDLFGDSSKYDSMFQTFKTQNNPITQPIDQMSADVFNLDRPKDQKYIKINQKKQIKNIQKQNQYIEESQQSIIFGQPIYVQNQLPQKYFYN